MAYNSPKMFQPIVLLDTLGKLIEKIIGNKLQNQSITFYTLFTQVESKVFKLVF